MPNDLSTMVDKQLWKVKLYSQGPEFPEIIIYCSTLYGQLLNKNLILLHAYK